jgi:hypothetical protein
MVRAGSTVPQCVSADLLLVPDRRYVDRLTLGIRPFYRIGCDFAVVFASTRLIAAVSAPKGWLPEIGESVTSRLVVMLYAIGLPSAPIPS